MSPFWLITSTVVFVGSILALVVYIIKCQVGRDLHSQHTPTMKILTVLCLVLVAAASVVCGQTIKLPDGIADKLPSVSFGGHPDEDRNACELIEARGFGCEVHYVRTRQDYIIEVHRIVNASGEPIRDHPKPVILQPGLTGSSTGFIIASETVPTDLNVTGQNMGFELARRGYDVWLSNNRGNEYGMNHTSLDPKDKKFWEWTWSEISEYDTPAIVDYVREQTQSDKVAYVGHSQGTAVMFALLSNTNNYDNVVEPYIALNPITRLNGATTTFRLLVAAMKPLLVFGGSALEKNPVTEGVTSIACRRPLNQICQAVFMSTVGFDNKELNSVSQSNK